MGRMGRMCWVDVCGSQLARSQSCVLTKRDVSAAVKMRVVELRVCSKSSANGEPFQAEAEGWM